MVNQKNGNGDLYSLLKDHLPGIFFTGYYEENYKITGIGKNCSEVMGYTPAELLERGMSLPDLIHPDDRELLITNHKLQFERNEPFINEFRVITKPLTIHKINKILRLEK